MRHGRAAASCAASPASPPQRRCPGLSAPPSQKRPPAPFSQFVDVAAEAGLTKTMFYGEGPIATYITEIMGGGCAFFDYDNDGWMDIFILGGRRLKSVPARRQQSPLPQQSRRHLYRRHRGRRPARCRLGGRRVRRRLQQRRIRRSLSHLLRPESLVTATTATAPSPM